MSEISGERQNQMLIPIAGLQENWILCWRTSRYWIMTKGLRSLRKFLRVTVHATRKDWEKNIIQRQIRHWIAGRKEGKFGGLVFRKGEWREPSRPRTSTTLILIIVHGIPNERGRPFPITVSPHSTPAETCMMKRHYRHP